MEAVKAEVEAKVWWVIQGKEKVGPFTRAELQAMVGTGGIQATDLVWKEGLKKPILFAVVSSQLSAVATPSLESSASAKRPSTATQNPYQPPAVDAREAEPEGHMVRRWRIVAKVSFWVMIVAAVWALYILGAYLLFPSLSARLPLLDNKLFVGLIRVAGSFGAVYGSATKAAKKA